MHGEYIKYLKKHGKAIGKSANNGDILCQKIIKAYKMHYDCPGDPGVKDVLLGYINEYDEREY